VGGGENGSHLGSLGGRGKRNFMEESLKTGKKARGGPKGWQRKEKSRATGAIIEEE